MNPIKGEVPLVLSDGRTFTLLLDMEALVEAETAYRKPMARMMADAAEGFVGATRAMLYGALRAKHPTITLRDASTMFQTDADAVADALERAVTASHPASEGGEGKDSPNPPGKPSGANGAKPASTRKRSGGQRRAPSS